LKIYSFKKDTGKHVTQFDSNFIMTRMAATESGAHIGCMYLDPDGIIGYHKAVVPQLLLIIDGSGRARGSDVTEVHVEKGDAIFWEEGEYHGVVSARGLVAIVLESETLKPGAFMTERGE